MYNPKSDNLELPFNREIDSSLTIFLLYFLVGLVLYWNTLDSPFIFDDHHVIADLSLDEAFNKCKSPQRIIAHLSFALNLFIWGNDVRSFHIINTVIHIVTSFGVYLLLLEIIAKRTDGNSENKFIAAFLGGTIFLVHPLATQSVTYICQRYTSLATVFYIYAFYFYIKARNQYNKNNVSGTRHILWYSLSLVLLIISLLTKEFPISFPIIVLLAEVIFFRKEKHPVSTRLKWFLPILITSSMIVLLYLPKQEQNHVSIPINDFMGSSLDVYVPHWAPENISRRNYFYTQIETIWKTYMKLLVYPVKQSFDHYYIIRDNFFTAQVIWSFLGIITLIIAAILSVKKFLCFSFGIFWFFITVLPTSSIVPSKILVAEHRLYLPLIAVSFLVVEIINSIKKPHLKLIVFTPIIVTLGCLTVKRNYVWQNNYSVWKDASIKAPEKDRPHLALGDIYYDRGKLADAVVEYQKFIELNQNYSGGYVRLGRALNKQGKFQEAVIELENAKYINPSDPTIYKNLIDAYVKLDQKQKLIETYLVLSDLTPNNYYVYYNLGTTFAAVKDWDKAITSLNKAIKINSTNAQAYSNLGTVYRKIKSPEKALEYYNKALRFSTNIEELGVIHLNKGILYNAISQYENAIEEFGQALIVFPNSPSAHLSISQAYFNIKNFGKAIFYCDEASNFGAIISPEYLNKLEMYR